MGDVFDAVAMALTKQDKGGDAGEQLSIAEARQALSNLVVIIKELSVSDFVQLLAGARHEE